MRTLANSEDQDKMSFNWCFAYRAIEALKYVLAGFTLIYGEQISSNGRHSGPIFFKPEKNLQFFRLKNWPTVTILVGLSD